MTETWYPIIDHDKCIGCKRCIGKCKHGVFKIGLFRTKPKVVYPQGCIQNCHGCGKICPSGAITYFGDE